MDYSRLDLVRRSATPVELDLVESFANGRITRRQFIKRATVIGLSMSAVSMVIAACSTGQPSGSAAAPSESGGASPSGSASASAATGGSIKVAIQRPVQVDPIAMQDLGGYGVVAQCFEFLCTLDKNGSDIAPGLAESWEPNETGSVWTFKLRSGVKWQDGSDFTADDVVATMSRLVAAGNSGLKGVIDDKSAVATDPTTVTFTLLSPNGNFPYLVSVFNAQTVITPKAYETGTTLDAMPNGTGAWKLETFDTGTGATYSRNETWWGGQTPLDTLEFVFFDETGPMVTAYQGGQVDCIVQFDVLSGEALLDDANTNVIATRAALHRQIWMRVDKGQFAKKEVRQALAFSLDREAMIQQLFNGRADLGNDHVIAPIYPYFDDSVPQRVRDVEKAKSLLGGQTITATAARRPAPRDPGSRGAHPEQCQGRRLQSRTRRGKPRHVLQRAVVPARPEGPAVLGRRGARDRRLRPPRYARRVSQRRAQDRRHLELVPVHVAGVRRRVQGVPVGHRRRGPEGRVQEDRDDPQRRGSDRPPILLQLPCR